jgi:lipoate-protein ligase A
MDFPSPSYPPADWRLILSEPLSGPENMAVDGAILEGIERGSSPPTLRLYRWDPPCLSLGYSQPFQDVDPVRLRERGWDIVRRPTGGRGILHTDELTYSVIGPRKDPRLEGGLMDSYQRLSRALFQALRYLGLPVEIHAGKDPEAYHQPVCFENPSDFEITAHGKKIIGSAQARKKMGILQHGSLPLGGDLTRITEVLTYSSKEERQRAARTLNQKAATVESILGSEITWDQACQAFISGFQETLNLKLIPGKLDNPEQDLIDQLITTRFGSSAWTEGRE